MRGQQMKKIGIWMFGLLLCSMGGCGVSLFSSASMPSGTWQLAVPTGSGLSNAYLTFDNDGNLTKIQMMVNSQNQTFTDITSQNISITGTTVTISAAFSGNTLNFQGTFDDSSQVLGTLTATINLGTGIIIEGDPARLIKQ
jgi:hypothetical protein